LLDLRARGDLQQFACAFVKGVLHQRRTVEFLRGKPINPKYEIWVNTAGMIALLAFMAFVTFSDVTKLIGF
jgi:hypothetical protein